MSGFIDHATSILEKALDGLTSRQSAISSNLANIDTPGYQAVTVDFETALRQQFDSLSSTPGNALPPSAGPSADVAMLRTDARHFDEGPSSLGTQGGSTGTTNESIRNDSNTVDLETEMTALTETQIKYSADSRLLEGKFSQLYSVLGGH